MKHRAGGAVRLRGCTSQRILWVHVGSPSTPLGDTTPDPQRVASCLRELHSQFHPDKRVDPETPNAQVLSLSVATRNAKRNGAAYRHLLLYGPPGTGKTMVAKRLVSVISVYTRSVGEIFLVHADQCGRMSSCLLVACGFFFSSRSCE